MTRHGSIEQMLARYGNPVQVGEAGSPISCRAMIQALGRKNKAFPDGAYLQAGYFDDAHYMYVGPAEHRLDQMLDPEVLSGDKRFRVRRAELMALGGEPLYMWAILEEKVAEDGAA